jgi:hypothetical protein
MAILEGRHGSARKAAKHYGLDKSYWKRLRDGEKKNPSDEVLASLGIERRVEYVLHVDGETFSQTIAEPKVFPPKMEYDIVGINADLARVFPGKPLTVAQTFKDLEGYAIALDHLVACTEDQMFAHLKQFAGRGIPDPDMRATGHAGPQWKALGPYNYWQKGGGRVEAICHPKKKLYAAAL